MKLYPTGREYLAKVTAATRRAEMERWFTPADGQRVIAEATAAARRMDAERTAFVRHPRLRHPPD
jgi:hypothetical protein